RTVRSSPAPLPVADARRPAAAPRRRRVERTLRRQPGHEAEARTARARCRSALDRFSTAEPAEALRGRRRDRRPPPARERGRSQRDLPRDPHPFLDASTALKPVPGLFRAAPARSDTRPRTALDRADAPAADARAPGAAGARSEIAARPENAEQRG